MVYELKTEKFSGPLEKLLELIEAQKMDVSEVSMAAVTEDFLRYIEKLRAEAHGMGGAETAAFREDLRLVADFIAVASRLVFLKSKYLLPGVALTEDEEADIRDLEERLKNYRAFASARRAIAALWRESPRSYGRPYFIGRGVGLAAGQSVFYPGGNVAIPALAAALGRIFETIKNYELETRTIEEKIVRLEEKIAEVFARVEKEGHVGISGSDRNMPRADIIILFLAVLYLAHAERVALMQKGIFSDIMVEKKTQSSIRNPDQFHDEARFKTRRA